MIYIAKFICERRARKVSKNINFVAVKIIQIKRHFAVGNRRGLATATPKLGGPWCAICFEIYTV